MVVKQGSSFPEGVSVPYVKLTAEETDALTCAIPINYNLSKEAKEKKLLIVAFPGAFTPACSQKHLPDYLKDENLKTLKSKGVDKVIFLSANDPFVLQAFAKAYKVEKDEFKRDFTVFASDPLAKFSESLGLSLDLSDKGLGKRTGRYVLVADHGKVSYVGAEPEADVTVSDFKTTLSHLWACSYTRVNTWWIDESWYFVL